MADKPKPGGIIFNTAVSDGQRAVKFSRRDLELLSRKCEGDADKLEIVNRLVLYLIDIQSALNLVQQIGGEAKRARSEESPDATDV